MNREKKRERKTYAQHEFYYFDRIEFFFPDPQTKRTGLGNSKESSKFILHKNLCLTILQYTKKKTTPHTMSHLMQFPSHAPVITQSLFSLSFLFCTISTNAFLISKEFEEKNKDWWNYLHRLKKKEIWIHIHIHRYISSGFIFLLPLQLCFLCVQLNEKPDVELRKKKDFGARKFARRRNPIRKLNSNASCRNKFSYRLMERIIAKKS